MNESFRIRKSILVQGLAFTLLFLSATLASAGVPFFAELAQRGLERDQSAPIVGGIVTFVFGAMTLLGVYMLLACYVERVTVAGTVLSVRSVFGNRQFDAAAVDKLAWKTRPVGGRIDCFVAGRRTTVELNGYSMDDRLRLVRLFRGFVPEEKQADWPMFCQKIALPLRETHADALQGGPARPLAPGQALITRWRDDRLAAVVLPTSFIAAGVVWWANGSTLLLWTAWILAAAWLFLRYTTRRGGERAVRLTAMPGH